MSLTVKISNYFKYCTYFNVCLNASEEIISKLEQSLFANFAEIQTHLWSVTHIWMESFLSMPVSLKLF